MNPGPASILDARSPQAQAILGLLHFDLVLSAVIFATVTALVVTAIVRFRHRPGAPEPEQDEGNPRLELVWTVVPFLVLVALFIGTVRVMSVVNPPVGDRRPDVVVVGHQWWWEFRYPASGVVTANELHLPLDRTCLLEIRSADVIHDFWAPNLGAKMDAVPGSVNHLWITPRHAGTYLGTCAEFCGSQHALMGIRVVVQPAAQFDAWERRQRLPRPPPAGARAAEGARIFHRRTCGNCHAIAGTAAQGSVGPDLTHLGDRATLAAGVLANDPDDLVRWLEDPQRYKPGCLMPDLHLTRDEAGALAAYLDGPR